MPAVLWDLNMGEKNKYWSYRDATCTAEQLAKNYTTLIWGRLLCDATIKSYRVNKCTRVVGLAACITDTSTNMGEKKTTKATATRLVPLKSTQKTTQLWYKADSCATSVSKVMAICPFWSGGSIRHSMNWCQVSLSRPLSNTDTAAVGTQHHPANNKPPLISL